MTWPDLFAGLAEQYETGAKPPFDFAVVDEAQDIAIPELRFLAALGGGRRDTLFFAGDLGQRIFQQPFSWKSLGVDIRGRSHTLRINYRTSHQIRAQEPGQTRRHAQVGQHHNVRRLRLGVQAALRVD